jgi:fructokinase
MEAAQQQLQQQAATVAPRGRAYGDGYGYGYGRGREFASKMAFVGGLLLGGTLVAAWRYWSKRGRRSCGGWPHGDHGHAERAQAQAEEEARKPPAAAAEKKEREPELPADVLLGGVETGGTTFVVSVARGSPTNIIEQAEFKTETPATTLQKVYEFLKSKGVAAVGVASFGPIDMGKTSATYGFMTKTPKPGWADCDILGPLRPLGVPLEFSTDVQAAAMGELKHGRHGNVRNCCYVTVGTGVGVGVVIDGQPIFGLTHPEGGHVRVKRHEADKFKGVCPFHDDCLEGLTCAAAVARRVGCQPSELASVPADHEVWRSVAYYLAQLCATITLMTCPEVIVLGGGVLKNRALFPMIREGLVKELNGYLAVPRITERADTYIVPSVFDQEGHKSNAGSVGALELARVAYLDAKKRGK